MKDRIKDRIERRQKRRFRIRKRVIGTPDRPRLAVYRSLKYIYCQIIDDTKGHTLLSISDSAKTLETFQSVETDKKGKVKRSYLAGKAIAKLALEKGIKQVAFDRGGYLYHGRIKAFAEGARESGLLF